MRRILLLEDDVNISEMVQDFLLSEQFEIETAFSGSEALQNFTAQTFDLILIDLMLPDFSGFNVIREIRKSSTIPIIIITAKDSDADKTTGFNLGADDYITKPFSLFELLARVKSNIRRVVEYDEKDNHAAEEVISLKDLTINITRHSVLRKDEDVKLTFTEFEILKLLAQNPGRAFSKENIYNHVWKEVYYGNEYVLNAHMNRLRNKLKNDSGNEEYIETLWGIGYRVERN